MRDPISEVLGDENLKLSRPSLDEERVDQICLNERGAGDNEEIYHHFPLLMKGRVDVIKIDRRYDHH